MDETIKVTEKQQNVLPIVLTTNKPLVEGTAADRSPGAGRRAPPSVTINSAIAQVSNQMEAVKHRDDALGSEEDQS